MLAVRVFVRKHFLEFIAMTTLKQLAEDVHWNNVDAMQRETNHLGFHTSPETETAAAFATRRILLSSGQGRIGSGPEARLLSILAHMLSPLTVNIYSHITCLMIYNVSYYHIYANIRFDV